MFKLYNRKKGPAFRSERSAQDHNAKVVIYQEEGLGVEYRGRGSYFSIC